MKKLGAAYRALKAQCCRLDLAYFVEATTRTEEGQRLILHDWQRNSLLPILTPVYEFIQAKKSDLGARIKFKGLRVRIHAPPQYGKSVIISKRFPLWLLINDPLHRIVICSFNEDMAHPFYDALANPSPEFKELFCVDDDGNEVPFLTGSMSNGLVTKERRALGDGSVSIYFCSINVGFTGRGGDTIIIDDPYRSLDDATSLAYRRKVVNFFEGGLNSRIQADTNVFIMYHAWAKGDLGDYVVKKFGFTPYRFAAVADDNKNGDDPTGREPGELLGPKHSAEALAYIEERTPAIFHAMFQGAPMEEMSKMFKEEYFENAFIKPSQVPALGKWWRGLDTAIGEKEVNDDSATIKMAFDDSVDELGNPDPILYLRMPQTEKVAPAKIASWIHGIIKNELTTSMIVEQHNAGYRVVEYFSRMPIFKNLVKTQEIQGAQGGKRKRAQPLAEMAGRGRVKIVMEGEWKKLYDQLLDFTGYIPGEEDDLIDAITVVLTFIKESSSKRIQPQALTPEAREAQREIERLQGFI